MVPIQDEVESPRLLGLPTNNFLEEPFSLNELETAISLYMYIYTALGLSFIMIRICQLMP